VASGFNYFLVAVPLNGRLWGNLREVAYQKFLTVIFDNIGIMPQVLNDVKRFSTNFYKIVKFHFWIHV